MNKAMVLGALGLATFSSASALAGFEGTHTGAFVGDPVFGMDAVNATLRVEYGVDTNVQLAPDKTFLQNPPGTRLDTESAFSRVVIDGNYIHSLSSRETVGIALTGSALFYVDTVPTSPPGIGTYHDYNNFILSPTIFYNVTLDGVDVQIYYRYRWEQGIDVAAIGLDGHTVGFQLLRDLSPAWRIRGGASVSFSDYNVEFPDMDLNDRDATYLRLEAGGDYFIQGGRVIVSGTAHYGLNDSEGLNWAYDAWGAELTVRGMIVPHVHAKAKIGFEHRNYEDGFQGFVTAPGRTEQDIVTAEARVSYQINSRFSVDVFAQHADYSSNGNSGVCCGGSQPDSDFFEGDKTVYGIGLNVKLY